MVKVAFVGNRLQCVCVCVKPSVRKSWPVLVTAGLHHDSVSTLLQK